MENVFHLFMTGSNSMVSITSELSMNFLKVLFTIGYTNQMAKKERGQLFVSKTITKIAGKWDC
jgi:hypothetical protein